MVLKLRNNLGFPDNDRTYALVAGLVSTAFFFGSFAGPIFGGVAMDTIGYKLGSLAMAGVTLALVSRSNSFMRSPPLKSNISCKRWFVLNYRRFLWLYITSLTH